MSRHVVELRVSQMSLASPSLDHRLTCTADLGLDGSVIAV